MKKTIRYFPILFVKNTIKIITKSESKETACLKLKEKYLLNDKQVEYGTLTLLVYCKSCCENKNVPICGHLTLYIIW